MVDEMSLMSRIDTMAFSTLYGTTDGDIIEKPDDASHFPECKSIRRFPRAFKLATYAVKLEHP